MTTPREYPYMSAIEVVTPVQRCRWWPLNTRPFAVSMARSRRRCPGRAWEINLRKEKMSVVEDFVTSVAIAVINCRLISNRYELITRRFNF